MVLFKFSFLLAFAVKPKDGTGGNEQTESGSKTRLGRKGKKPAKSESSNKTSVKSKSSGKESTGVKKSKGKSKKSTKENKSRKRKSNKGKSIKRKSTKGKSTKRKSIKGKPTKRKSSKLSLNSRKDEPETPNYILNTGTPIGYVHIEYETYPNKRKQAIDVVCWEKVGKIYFRNQTKTFATITNENLVWLPVCVKHEIKLLETEELYALQQHIMNFQIFIGPKKIPGKVKGEKSKMFYIKQEDVGGKTIIEAYSEDPNKPGFKLETQEGGEDLLVYPNPIHCFQLGKTIRKEAEGKRVVCKDFYLPCPVGSTEDQEFGEKEDDVSKYLLSNRLANMNKGMDWEKGKRPKKKSANSKKKSDKSKKNSVKSKKYSVKSKKSKKNSVKSKINSVKSKKNSVKPKNKSTKTKTKHSREKSKTRREKTKSQTKPSKISKKNKEGRKKTVDVLKFQVPGEVFYTDPYYARYRLESNNRTLVKAFLITGSKILMTFDQEVALNPFIISVKKLSNIPVDHLKRLGFNSIYCQYVIPKVIFSKTLEKPIEKTIHFHDSHVIFCRKFPKETIELIQTRGLTIDIIGVRSEKTLIAPHLFGTEEEDNIMFTVKSREYRRKLLRPFQKTVKVGTCPVDLMFLINPYWQDIRERVSCYNPDSVLRESLVHKQNFFTDKPLVNEINLKPCLDVRPVLPCSNGDYFEHGTYLKIEAAMDMPQNYLKFQIPKKDATFNRLCFVSTDWDFVAKAILMMHENNEEYLESMTFLLYERININQEKKQEEEYVPVENIATGFLLETGETYVFFVEDFVNGLCSRIWNEVITAPNPKTKAYYGTNYIFANRLYGDFIGTGGFTFIYLVKSLDDILSDPGIYVKGNLPTPCFEALRKFDMILRSGTLRVLNQRCTWPSSKELLSLKIEYGLPMEMSALFRNSACPINFVDSRVFNSVKLPKL